MRFKQPVRGIHIGRTCVDGTPFRPDEAAHAHANPAPGAKHDSAKWTLGYICARSKRDLSDFLLHEIAHLAADAGHDDRWRKSLRRLGGRVPAAYRKKPRRKD